MVRYPKSLIPKVTLDTAQPDLIEQPWPKRGYVVIIERSGVYYRNSIAWFEDRNKALRYAAELSMMSEDVGDIVTVSLRGPMFDKGAHTIRLATFRDGEYEPIPGRISPRTRFGRAGRYEY